MRPGLLPAFFMALLILPAIGLCGGKTTEGKPLHKSQNERSCERRIKKIVRKAIETVRKGARKSLQCVISVEDDLAESLQNLLCLQTANDDTSILVYVELGAEFQKLTIRPESPPPYTPSYCPEYLKLYNPSLWMRLGLDSLPATTSCINHQTSEYSVKVDVLRNRLAHQDSIQELPYVDVHLQDIGGNSFSLSELPFEWLRSPEIVAHIEKISPANKRKKLARIAEGIDLARQLAKAIANKTSLDELGYAAKRARLEARDLNSFRCEEMDFIDWSISQDGRYQAMRCLYDNGKIKPREQHLVSSLGKRQRDSNAVYRLYTTLVRLQKSKHKASNIATPSGNLMAWALANDADHFSLVAITDTYGYQTPVTLENFLDFLRKEQLSPPVSKGYQWRTTELFLRTLRKQNAQWKRRLKEKITPEETLVDYVQHHRLADYWVLYSLYHGAGIKATKSQLIKAIKQSSIRGGDPRVPLLIINRLKEQGVDLKRWRSDTGETLAEYGYREGAPVKVITDLHYLKSTARFTLPPASIFKPERRVKNPGKKKPISMENWQLKYIQQILQSEQTPFVVNNPDQYLTEVSGILNVFGYKIVDVPGDGQCFLHSVAGMLGITESMAKQIILEKLRQLLDRYISESPLDDSEKEIISWLGADGLQQAILDFENNGWVDAHLAPLVSYAFYGRVNHFSGFYLVSPNPQGQPVVSHILPNGAVLPDENIPPHSPVLIFNGVNHFMYARSARRPNTQTEKAQEELSTVVKSLAGQKRSRAYLDSGNF